MIRVEDANAFDQQVRSLALHARGKVATASWQCVPNKKGFLICLNSALAELPAQNLLNNLQPRDQTDMMRGERVELALEQERYILQYISEEVYQANREIALDIRGYPNPLRVQVWRCAADGTDNIVYIPQQATSDACATIPATIRTTIDLQQRWFGFGETQYVLSAQGLEDIKNTPLYNNALVYKIQGQPFAYPILGDALQKGFVLSGKGLDISFEVNEAYRDCVTIQTVK